MVIVQKDRNDMSIKRKYPVGIQSFESIRKDGYLYVDKTPLVYKMITEGKTYFLSRPVTNVGISFSSEERNITEWKSIAK
jgi:hypothetical protein